MTVKPHPIELVALTELLGKLNEDEYDVVRQVVLRLIAGRKQYGPLDLASDPRDFHGEAVPELLDAVAYLAMDAIRRGRHL